MSGSFLNDIITTIIQPDRLAPQDAEDKKRHKHRRRHSSDGRSDEKSRDGHRSRSRVDDGEGEKRRHRDRSAHRSRGEDDEGERRRDKSSQRPRRDDDDVETRHRRDPKVSRGMEYGEHRFDDLDTGAGDGSSHRSKSRRRFEDDIRSDEGRLMIGPPSSSSGRPPIPPPDQNYDGLAEPVSIELPYGEHRFDDRHAGDRPGHRRESSRRSKSRNRDEEGGAYEHRSKHDERERNSTGGHLDPFGLPSDRVRSKRPSPREAYGDHRFDESGLPGEQWSEVEQHGDHRFDDRDLPSRPRIQQGDSRREPFHVEQELVGKSRTHTHISRYFR